MLTQDTSLPRRITPQTVGEIRFPLFGSMSREAAAWYVRQYPGMSWYLPGTRDYLIAHGWRHRLDIAEVLETRGGRSRPALWQALVNDPERAFNAVLIDSDEFRGAERFYRSVGVSVLEQVVVLDTGRYQIPQISSNALKTEVANLSNMAALLEVDHDAFPWLWHNSEEEFREYLQTEGVQALLGYQNGRAVGYVSFTDFDGWGHIDRLAVRRDAQGQGLGSQLLANAMMELQRLGATRLQLSTQTTNYTSQKLYARFGFQKVRGTYELYGMYLPNNT